MKPTNIYTKFEAIPELQFRCWGLTMQCVHTYAYTYDTSQHIAQTPVNITSPNLKIVLHTKALNDSFSQHASFVQTTIYTQQEYYTRRSSNEILRK